MKYVYALQSTHSEEHYYVGSTDNLEQRLEKHNNRHVPHTTKHKPWTIKTYIAFTDDQKAIDFERYLKSSSGSAFTKRRL